MKKIPSLKQIITYLANKLGHEPSMDEVRREINGVGFIVLSEKIIGTSNE